jgi:rhodanese-related sulfurtransferase
VAGVSLLGSSCAADADDHREDLASAVTTAPSTSSALVGPDAFARRIEAPGVVTINVHTPDEGSIAGTDLTIPFDRIATSGELPADLSTPLAVYCRSGNMSADAVVDLETLGYTDIVELDGGFNAWTRAGRPLDTTAAG